MPTLEITGPDGKTIELEAPEGATPEQINAKVAQIKSQWSSLGGPQTSMLGSIARGLGQAAFGLGDEAEALVRAGLDPNKTYADVIPEVRQQLAQSQAEHPYATYGAEIAGSVALPFGLAAKGIGYTAKAAGQGLPALMKAGAKEGALYGAAYGAGKSEGGLQERAEGAIGGAGTGAVIGGAVPGIIGGVGKIADEVASAARAVTNPTDEATRRVAKALIADDEIAREARSLGRTPFRLDSNPEAQALVNQGVVDPLLVDTGGNTARAMLRSASNNSPEARDIVESAIMPRSDAQTSRVSDFLRNLTGRQGSAFKAGEKLAAEKAAMTDPLYTVARELGDRPIWNKRLEALTGSDTVRSAMQKAAKEVDDRAISKGYGAMNVGVSFDNGVMRFTRGADKRTSLPNLEFWDQTKRTLDDAVKVARRNGDMDAASRIGEIAKALRNELDQAVPQYKTARGVAANYFDAEDALDAGQKFALGRYDFDEVASMASKMKPKERDLFEEGFVSAYLDKISRTGDRRDLTKVLMSDVNARKSFEAALGKDKARQLEAFLHVEKIMEASKNALGNSTTARQLIETGLAGIGGGMVLGGSPTDPAGFIAGALMKWAPGQAKSAIDKKMAVRIAELLTSKNPQNVRLAYQQLSKPDNLALLRRISAGVTGAGANIGANVAAQGGQQ